MPTQESEVVTIRKMPYTKARHLVGSRSIPSCMIDITLVGYAVQPLTDMFRPSTVRKENRTGFRLG